MFSRATYKQTRLIHIKTTVPRRDSSVNVRKGFNMIFLFEKQIVNALKEEFAIDINDNKYKKTTFSVDSIEIEDSVNFPFSKTYKGFILIYEFDKPIKSLFYTIKSYEGIPNKAICILTSDK